ncbi:MAG: hypothetical protein GYA50_03885 [Eubacteriaceae bacterium]|nr:hypothetical protein [Eubacteriaceae bacterium]
MVKIAVIYATKTNHSKKLAQAIASALNIEAQNIKENPILKGIDMIFIVGGIYGGVSMPELIEYVNKIDEQTLKHAALVTSCASGKQMQTVVRSILEEKAVKVLDEFVCKGNFLFVSAKHPNSNDLKEAADFALKIASSNI